MISINPETKIVSNSTRISNKMKSGNEMSSFNKNLISMPYIPLPPQP
jgi:hypothetical protein